MRYEKSGEFAGAPRDYWNLIAQTDSLNREAGLPEVEYEFHPRPDGTVRTLASVKKFGLTLRWQEQPFEWVEPQGYRVQRLFENGPFREIHGGARLEPAGDKTRVAIFADIQPRGAFGWLAARSFAERELSGMLEVCRGWERYLRGETACPYPRRTGHASVDEAALEEAVAALAQTPVPADARDRLIRHLRDGPEEQVLRMRPNELADAWKLDRLVLLRTMLYATSAGLLELAYAVLCPSCRGARATKGALSELTRESSCDT
ncbi:MAG: hypothetical protein HYZ53_15215 [Planctomycetes bacterium]|nr:hypothetical protein [Planctomycetota bacterium]